MNYWGNGGGTHPPRSQDSSKNRELAPGFFRRMVVKMKVLTPMKRIRAKCLDFSGQQPKEVRLCPVTTCTLWPFRMGRRPNEHDKQVAAHSWRSEAATLMRCKRRAG